MSNSLQPHGLQQARLPCPSLPPRICSNSCPLSWWCHPAISSSVVPFSSHLQSCPASGAFPMKVYILKAVVFPVVMYGCKLDHKECWVPKNWCFYLGSPLDCKKNKPVNPKGNQPWIFIGRTDAELQYFGHLMWRASWLEKTDAGKDWRQKEKWGVRAWSD